MRFSHRAQALTTLCAVAFAVSVNIASASSGEDAVVVADNPFARQAGVDETALAGAAGEPAALRAPQVDAAPAAAEEEVLAQPDNLFAAALQEQNGAVDESALEDVRGGFVTSAGLVMSLGIERLVTINGDIVSSQSLHIADVSKLSQEQARGAEALAAVNLIQNGAGNVFLPGDMGNTLGGTIIQNSLSNQDLKTQTIINSSVNSAELLKSMNFNGSVRDALANSLAPK